MEELYTFLASPGAAAWAQTVASMLLLLVTGYYARHAAKLEKRESAKDVRERRSLAVPLLAKCEKLLSEVDALNAHARPTQTIMMDLGPAHHVTQLSEHLGLLLQDALRVDAELARIATNLQAQLRGWEGPDPRSFQQPSPDALSDLKRGVQSFVSRCSKIIDGTAAPV